MIIWLSMLIRISRVIIWVINECKRIRNNKGDLWMYLWYTYPTKNIGRKWLITFCFNTKLHAVTCNLPFQNDKSILVMPYWEILKIMCTTYIIFFICLFDLCLIFCSLILLIESKVKSSKPCKTFSETQIELTPSTFKICH